MTVKVAAYLEQEMGFKNVTRLEGGIVSYSKFAKEQGLESKFKVPRPRVSLSSSATPSCMLNPHYIESFSPIPGVGRLGLPR